MKIQKIILSFMIGIGGIIPFITFGLEETDGACSACGSSPTKLTLINSFITEILSNIHTIGTEGSYAGKHVPPSRFDSGKFIAPKQNIVYKSLRRAREEVGSVLAITRISLDFSNLANIGDSLGVLAQSKVILRDRQKQEKLAQDINRKKYELSVGGGRNDKIGGVTLIRMRKIIERYKELEILEQASGDNGNYIDDGAEYGDLIMLLGRTNDALKHLIALGGNDRAAGEKDILFKLPSKGKVILNLNDDALNEIKSDYGCTRRYACEDSMGNYKEAFKKIRDAFKDGNKSAATEIKRANDELVKEILKIKETNIKRREKTKEISKKTWNAVSGAAKKTRDTTTNPGATLKDIKDRRKKAIAQKEKIEEQELKEKEKQKIQKQEALNNQANALNINNYKDNIKDNFIIRINNTENLIKNEAHEIYNKYAILDTPYDILTYFVFLSEKINGITNNVIGSKDSDTNCLIKSLGSLCEKQCSNIGNKSCYY